MCNRSTRSEKLSTLQTGCIQRIFVNNVCEILWKLSRYILTFAVIFTTLTLNSTTLYSTENAKLVHALSNLNCSELVSQELGLINSSATLIGSFPVQTNSAVTKNSLLLYFMKKNFQNQDGSNDLVTVVALAHQDVNKTLILSVLKKIIDKYFEFSKEISRENSPANHGEQQPPNKLGEFKLYMTQIIKFEEMQYDTNQRMYNYGATDQSRSTSPPNGSYSDEVITPNQLLLANEEVGEVRSLMLDNINRIMNRGDKINLLVDQTDRLQTSSLVFQKKAQLIKRKMWFRNVKLVAILSIIFAALIYFFVGFECGFPAFGHCIHH